MLFDDVKIRRVLRLVKGFVNYFHIFFSIKWKTPCFWQGVGYKGLLYRRLWSAGNRTRKAQRLTRSRRFAPFPPRFRLLDTSLSPRTLRNHAERDVLKRSAFVHLPIRHGWP